MRTGLLAAALAITLSAQAQVYKWQDEAGRWHYGDQPPDTGQAVEQTDIPSGPSPAAPGLRQSEREGLKQIEDRERREARQREADAKRRTAAARQQAIADENNRKACARYTEYLEAVKRELRSGYTAEKAGTLHERRSRYQRKVDEHCQ